MRQKREKQLMQVVLIVCLLFGMVLESRQTVYASSVQTSTQQPAQRPPRESGAAGEEKPPIESNTAGNLEQAASGEVTKKSSVTAEPTASPVGKKAEEDSWPVIFYVLIGCGVFAVVAIGVIIFLRMRKKPEEEQVSVSDSRMAQTPVMPPEKPVPQEPLIELREPSRKEEKQIPTPAVRKTDEQKKARLWLAAIGGYMNGRMYPIEKHGITIGRERSNSIQYPKDAPGVSRTHARLSWEQGKLMLMDCNSSSGTFVKGVGKLVPMQPYELKSGDVFYIGEKKNGFEIKRI